MAGKPKSSKRSRGSVLAKANRPAKAGHRKMPAARKGKHLTSPEARAAGRYCAKYGLSTEHLRTGNRAGARRRHEARGAFLKSLKKKAKEGATIAELVQDVVEAGRPT